jgi:hypothetical protein
MIDRTDTIELVSNDAGYRFVYDEANLPCIYSDSRGYNVSESAIEPLLNALKIPVKYLRRCPSKMQEDSINYWLKNTENVGFVVEGGSIVQIYDTRRLFIPTAYVDKQVESNTFVSHLLDRGISDSLYWAIYTGYEGETGYIQYGPDPEDVFELAIHGCIRLIYSDCFETIPRVDTGLWWRVDGWGDGHIFYPVRGKKFRIAGATVSQVIEQIYDFVTIAFQQYKNDLAPSMKNLFDKNDPNNTRPWMIDVDQFVERMAADLRLSKKLIRSLTASVGTPMIPRTELVMHLSLALEGAEIDLLTKREIQNGIGKFIVGGSFK